MALGERAYGVFGGLLWLLLAAGGMEACISVLPEHLGGGWLLAARIVLAPLILLITIFGLYFVISALLPGGDDQS